MIKSITFTNWKSFRDATLYIDPLTVLIGANASGKSNALDAHLVLQRTASGRDLLTAMADSGRFEKAGALAKVMENAAQQRSPWAAFTEQLGLWDEEGPKGLAIEWPELAKCGFSIGDATIKLVRNSIPG